MVPSEAIVKKVLAKHGRDAKIWQAIQHGENAVKAHTDSGWWRRKGTRRAVFWESAVNKLIELIADDPAVQIAHHHDTVSFIFDDKVLVRIKKANFALRTSNVPTDLAELFHVHKADLFGYEGLQRVEAVYVTDRFEAEIIWTGIVAREKSTHLWHFEIAAEAVPAAHVLPLPTTNQPTAASLVKLKEQAQGKKKKQSKSSKDGD